MAIFVATLLIAVPTKTDDRIPTTPGTAKDRIPVTQGAKMAPMPTAVNAYRSANSKKPTVTRTWTSKLLH